MNIETRLHTIFMLVGPTECGKTTFAQEVLIPQLQMEDRSRHYRANVQYLSSDGLRQELLGYMYDKHDQVMLEASSHAFQALFDRLKLVTSFPVNAEFVIVDSTGLNGEFRSQIRAIARENNYNVDVILFDYRRREDYYASERSKKLISGHVNRLKREVLPVLAREEYRAIHRVRAKDFRQAWSGHSSAGAGVAPHDGRLAAGSEYRVTVTDRELYLSAVLPHTKKYVVVGDVHECVQELQELLAAHGFELHDGKLSAQGKARDTRIILAGDWIDKGKQTREMVQFLYRNREHFLLVLGNHENFVYKYLRGEISGAEPELLRSYFDSAAVLAGDAELFGQFSALVEQSKPFYRFIGVQGPSYYVTHAPCRNKYIGKLDARSLRHQRSFRIDRDHDASVEEQLAFLKEEAVANHPYHIFGHVAAKRAFRIKNKIHIDTGCVQGNLLTSVRLAHKPVLQSCKSRREAAVAEPLPVLFREERKVALAELDDEALRRLDYCSRNRINYIAGTMAPADKDEARGELESLKKGLDYFAERGVAEVVLQPKYMGSRCQVYLSREISECYAVSRNGYKIKAVDMSPVYERLLDRLGSYMAENEVAVMLLDGELLPWRALGDGLIERQFRPIGKALESELAFLKQHGFDESLRALFETYDASGFEKEQNQLPKAALSEKYGASVYQTFKHVRDVREGHVPLELHEEAACVYNRQLEIYAGDRSDAEDDAAADGPGAIDCAAAGTSVLEYKPFALLKEVLTNGEERLPDGMTSDMYRFLTDDEYLVIRLDDETAYEQAERFFAKLTMERHMEGVVIKPERAKSGIVPYMKVRNAEYLSIIYGYDYRFPRKYVKLLKQKNISAKLQASMNEHRLGSRMLAIRLGEISPSHTAFKEIAASLLFEVEQEKEIDPRL